MAFGELGPVRRVVTGHDSDARPVILADEMFDTEAIPSGAAEYVDLWNGRALPLDNNELYDCRHDPDAPLAGASIVRIVDLAPGGASQMHRTNTLDYCVLISGELELELEGAVTTRLKPGEIVVQRGTMHLWRNPSPTTPCRVVFVLTEAKPYVHGGAALPEVHG
jgi:quercetin dioxygenase-like cupin family protein